MLDAATEKESPEQIRSPFFRFAKQSFAEILMFEQEVTKVKQNVTTARIPVSNSRQPERGPSGRPPNEAKQQENPGHSLQGNFQEYLTKANQFSSSITATPANRPLVMAQAMCRP